MYNCKPVYYLLALAFISLASAALIGNETTDSQSGTSKAAIVQSATDEIDGLRKTLVNL